MCAKSRFTFEQRLSYARNRQRIQNPEGFAASRRASDGEFDEAISAWREEVEHPAGVRPERDVGACPDCHGSGWWYPAGPEKGAARCKHPRLADAVPDAVPVAVPP